MVKSIWVDYLGAEIKFVQGRKHRSRVAEAGRDHAETLVMVHGGGGHLETFARNVVPLARHMRVVAVEMLWHGLSDCPPIGESTLAQVTEQVLDIIDTMGLGKVWLHGEAGGASAITPLVLDHPERLKGVIWETGIGMAFKEGGIEPPRAPVGGIPMGERTLQLLDNPTWQAVKDRLLMVMHHDHPERVTDELVDVRHAHYTRPSTNAGQVAVYDYYLSGKGAKYLATEEQVSGIRLPVLVLWCDGSGGNGPDAGQRLASLIPGARFKLMPETGFWAHWEKPEIFNEAVRQFICGEKVT